MADQAAKRTASLSYDYDSDPRWADYWSNVLVPSHLAARPEVLRHFKLKFYQRYVDPELAVEPLSAISSPSPRTTPTSAETRRRSFSSGNQVDGADQPSVVPPTGRGWAKMDRQSAEFLANAWITVMATLAVFPFLPYSLADKTYRLSFIGSILTCLYAIYTNHGIPTAFNALGFQMWVQSVFTKNDFLYLLYSIFFVATSIPLKVAVLPLACRSLEQVVYYLRRNFSNAQLYKTYLDKPSNWVVAHANLLKSVSASAEIGLGFLLIFLIITPQRNILQAFVHWQLLKLMYRMPSTGSYHANTWRAIGTYANPLIRRYAPFLESPIAFVEHWFNSNPA